MCLYKEVDIVADSEFPLHVALIQEASTGSPSGQKCGRYGRSHEAVRSIATGVRGMHLWLYSVNLKTDRSDIPKVLSDDQVSRSLLVSVSRRLTLRVK